MLWPNEAKDAIAKSFYDKMVVVLSTSVQKDEEGGIIRNNTASTDESGSGHPSETVKSSFLGNVRFNNLGEIQADLGLVESIDVVITCNENAEIAVDDVFRLDAHRRYVATNVIPSDSHLTVVGKLCR